MISLQLHSFITSLMATGHITADDVKHQLCDHEPGLDLVVYLYSLSKNNDKLDQ